MQNKSSENFEEHIVDSLRRIIRAVDVYSHELSARHALTGPQLTCLRALARNGELALGALASNVSLSPATVSGIVDRLESKGLVARRRRVSDRRSVAIGLTRAGKTLVRKAPAPLQETFTRRLAALPAGKRNQISGVLQQIVTMMEPEALPPPRSRRGKAVAEPKI